jgi:hypothetical protein
MPSCLLPYPVCGCQGREGLAGFARAARGGRRNPHCRCRRRGRCLSQTEWPVFRPRTPPLLVSLRHEPCELLPPVSACVLCRCGNNALHMLGQARSHQVPPAHLLRHRQVGVQLGPPGGLLWPHDSLLPRCTALAARPGPCVNVAADDVSAAPRPLPLAPQGADHAQCQAPITPSRLLRPCNCARLQLQHGCSLYMHTLYVGKARTLLLPLPLSPLVLRSRYLEEGT